MNKSLNSFVLFALVVVSVGLPLYLFNEIRQLGNIPDRIEQVENDIESVKLDLLEKTEELEDLQDDFDQLKDRVIGSPSGSVESA